MRSAGTGADSSTRPERRGPCRTEPVCGGSWWAPYSWCTGPRRRRPRALGGPPSSSPATAGRRAQVTGPGVYPWRTRADLDGRAVGGGGGWTFWFVAGFRPALTFSRLKDRRETLTTYRHLRLISRHYQIHNDLLFGFRVDVYYSKSKLFRAWFEFLNYSRDFIKLFSIVINSH